MWKLILRNFFFYWSLYITQQQRPLVYIWNTNYSFYNFCEVYFMLHYFNSYNYNYILSKRLVSFKVIIFIFWWVLWISSSVSVKLRFVCSCWYIWHSVLMCLTVVCVLQVSQMGKLRNYSRCWILKYLIFSYPKMYKTTYWNFSSWLKITIKISAGKCVRCTGCY